MSSRHCLLTALSSLYTINAILSPLINSSSSPDDPDYAGVRLKSRSYDSRIETAYGLHRRSRCGACVDPPIDVYRMPACTWFTWAVKRVVVIEQRDLVRNLSLV